VFFNWQGATRAQADLNRIQSALQHAIWVGHSYLKLEPQQVWSKFLFKSSLRMCIGDLLIISQSFPSVFALSLSLSFSNILQKPIKFYTALFLMIASICSGVWMQAKHSMPCENCTLLGSDAISM
jgi:hypothetical protein